MDVPAYLGFPAAAAVLSAACALQAAVAARRAAAPSRPATGASTPVPLRLAVVGAPESGRTMLIVAMAHRLSTVGIRPVGEHGDELTQLCRLLAEAEPQVWSCAPVDTIRRYELAYPADPAAGRSAPHVSLLEHPAHRYPATPDADVLLATVDGARLADELAGRTSESFQAELAEVLDVLGTHRNTVAYLTVTKWDKMLRSDGRAYDLGEVLEFLDRLPDFRRLWRADRPASVRLVPVSAYGLDGYLTEDPEAPLLRKAAGLDWQPFQVELPLVLATSDLPAPAPLHEVLAGAATDGTAAAPTDER